MPRMASFTKISMCSARSWPAAGTQRTSRSAGYRSLSPTRTVRTVAPGATASSSIFRRVPSPPTSCVTQATVSTVTWGIAECGMLFNHERVCLSRRGGSGLDSRLPARLPPPQSEDQELQAEGPQGVGPRSGGPGPSPLPNLHGKSLLLSRLAIGTGPQKNWVISYNMARPPVQGPVQRDACGQETWGRPAPSIRQQFAKPACVGPPGASNKESTLVWSDGRAVSVTLSDSILQKETP